MPANVVLGVGEDLSFTMDFNVDPGELPELPDLSADPSPEGAPEGGEAQAIPEAEGPSAAAEAGKE